MDSRSASEPKCAANRALMRSPDARGVPDTGGEPGASAGREAGLMKRIDLERVTHWITAAALLRPDDLAGELQRRLAVGRASARRTLARLVDAQWLVRDGTPRRPHHRPGALRQVVRTYPLHGIDEDTCWRADFGPFFAFGAPVRRIVHHVFTELVNNAIDHSGGTRVTVSLRQTPTQAQLLVSDDGCGLFDRLSGAFGLADPAAAMLELAKGRLTSDTARHSGRGLYFSARLADVFDLHANAVAFQRRGWEGGRWQSGRGLNRTGTAVYAAVALDTPRTIEAVLAAHGGDAKAARFDRTSVPLQLIADAGALASRAQARRVAARLAEFRRVELDFAGITHLGHGFADELFRVQAAPAPGVEVVQVNMCAAVAAMVEGVRQEAAAAAR
jgi:anti-sigma regulatory factor (Ser/Thr protein kinase)